MPCELMPVAQGVLCHYKRVTLQPCVEAKARLPGHVRPMAQEALAHGWLNKGASPTKAWPNHPTELLLHRQDSCHGQLSCLANCDTLCRCLLIALSATPTCTLKKHQVSHSAACVQLHATAASPDNLHWLPWHRCLHSSELRACKLAAEQPVGLLGLLCCTLDSTHCRHGQPMQPRASQGSV